MAGGGTGSTDASIESPTPSDPTLTPVRPANTATSRGEPSITDLLSWNHGRTTHWHWYQNSALRPDDDDAETGLQSQNPNPGAADWFAPGRSNNRATLDSLINMSGERALGLREAYAWWGEAVNGIRYAIATESDPDYIRASSTYYDSFNFTKGVRRSITGRGQYSAFLQQGNWLCRDAVGCESSGVRAAVWGTRSYTSGLPGDDGKRWLRRSGATASWRGAMSGSTVATGIALVGEAAVSYTVSDDSVGVELTNIEQRDDGSGAIEAVYSGPDSFTWALTDRNDEGYSDFWKWEPEFNSNVRFYGPNAEEAAGTFRANIPNDRIIGSFVTKR